MDIDNKNTADVQEGNSGAIASESSSTSVPPPKGYRGLNYFMTKEVAKIIGVTKPAVEIGITPNP